jgi:hypothetical protein
MPDQDAVLAITSGVPDMQQVLNAVWDNLLPAFQGVSLVPDPAAQARLAQRLASLKLAAPAGLHGSPTAERVSGHSYRMKKNKAEFRQVCFEFLPDHTILNVHTAEGAFAIDCGLGEWIESTIPMADRGPQPAAASAVWADPDTLVVTLRYTGTPFCHTLTCHFEGDRLSIASKANVGFGKLDLPILIGKMG